MNPQVSLEQLVQRFDAPGVQAIVLMGSYARGEAGPLSDIDVVRFSVGSELPNAGSSLVDGYLVVVSDMTPGQVERWFTDPEAATDSIMGVRSAQVLLDRDGYFAGIQGRARAFVWDQAMQKRANQCANAMLVGWD